MSKFIRGTILVCNARNLNGDFLQVAQTSLRLGQAVQKFAAIIHRAVVKLGHCLQIKIKSPVGRGDKFLLVLAHDANIYRISARDIQSLRAERNLDTFHAVFADMKINRHFLNLNFIAEKFLNVFNRVQAFDSVNSKLPLESLKGGVLLDKFTVIIGVGSADENINQIVKNSCGD